MRQMRAQSIAVMLAAIAVSVFLCACGGRKEMSNQVIVQNEVFTLTGDSVIEDSVYACVQGDHIKTNIAPSRLDSLYSHVDPEKVHFIQGKTWRMREGHSALMPEYSSDQPLLDALYQMSADHITDAVDKTGRFTSTNNNYSRLYCSIFLSLAALKPQQSMATLRSIVDKDSIIMQREGQWPVVSDHIGWATAAWEVYNATGDRKWLVYCYHVIEKTLNINRQVLLDHETGLVHGAGYTSSRPLGVRRMTWMGYNDLFACMSLGNNILTGNAYAILADMGDELGIENDYRKYAQRMKDAINQHLWNESKGFYSSFLYGMAYHRQSPLTDNTSQAMCVLWGIADDNRAEELIASTPVSDLGVNVSYPPGNPVEPYLANSSWATTQAMWNLAAAYVGNENALRRGMGALYRAQALYQSRGIHMKDVATDNLGTSASNAAMILRVLMGMNFTPEGIEFSPIVPACMPGKKTFKGLKYRKAVINLTIRGTGNDVTTITDNGKTLESPFIPNNIEDDHDIVITLKQAVRPSQHVTVHHGEAVLPPTPLVTWAGDSGYIEDYVPGTPYRLSINGQLQALNDSVFVLPQTQNFSEFSVEIAGKYCNGFMSRPLFHFGLTPQIAFFPDSPDGHTVITVSVAAGGDYLLDVGYHPTGTLDVRRVGANGHPMGTLVMASAQNADDDGLAYSNMVNIKLLKGENHIEFDQIRLPKAFTPCEPVHVRVITR
ncbi:MAG: hypothetical protein IJV05_07115 [Muribaculaceae bacterium]|nr:hypothetical protein [Muribaculaceae bacterium]